MTKPLSSPPGLSCISSGHYNVTGMMTDPPDPETGSYKWCAWCLWCGVGVYDGTDPNFTVDASSMKAVDGQWFGRDD